VAWIESHQTLGQHPKTRKLARLLNISVPTAVGHLQFLWWWAMDYAPDGSLERFEDADIADAVLWEGNAEALVDALRIAGFIDVNQIHDWDTYIGRLIDRRAANAERARESRERTRNVRATNAQRATLPNPTQHNTTELEKASPSAPVLLKAPKKTVPTEEWAAEMREKYRLRDFDETLKFFMNGSYYRGCADKCQYLEGKLKAASERERSVNPNGRKPEIYREEGIFAGSD